MNEPKLIVKLEELEKLSYEILLKYGLSEDDARRTAHIMHIADMRGVDTRGYPWCGTHANDYKYNS